MTSMRPNVTRIPKVSNFHERVGSSATLRKIVKTDKLVRDRSSMTTEVRIHTMNWNNLHCCSEKFDEVYKKGVTTATERMSRQTSNRTWINHDLRLNISTSLASVDSLDSQLT